MSPQSQQQFIQYLQTDLGVSDKAIDLALRCQEPSRGQLHMVLWQYGLLDLEQLGEAFEWQVNKTVCSSASDA
ncbi:DUF2949 domain-containing protein (plasmid) [Acaryochloris sp. 'Moss Beach']|uniref:DUF2949 domain-containing protein n=1 Tax=Acaryochloris sp. 'Moss Beach' TaxID=2740837 RepID=UPI001F398F97|nr:DUF2949 domain-containing protein [Acaryochloris sp. 'Moss Beach']UJB72761.1 DUF2949 domain-containing protein [Acaryochloris sp. 'Moss Beach']